ncbi:transcription-repair coupling factor [Pseudahrensia aquimaris]|uniref:Transcription-repair-coupling factor n=1 Tax=Pseudahrensia aquimaris TaxID=744461 RepID=A0ABW3FL10_9HYPH
MISQPLKRLANWLYEPGTTRAGGVPDGYEAHVLAHLLREASERGGAAELVYIARDGQRAQDIEATFGFFAPWADIVHIPAWDCLPYDRVSPSSDVLAQRISALSMIARGDALERPRLITLTPNSLLQKAPPRSVMGAQVMRLAPGQMVEMEELVGWLEGNGFQRTPTVRDAGEYAVRGGIVDLFAPGAVKPVRLDFFGSTLESVRAFDAESQRTEEQLREVNLSPMSEVTLDPKTIARFRTNYLSTFGAATRDDALYAAVSEGRRYAGMEHWLPLFYGSLETGFDYLSGKKLVVDNLVNQALEQRWDQIEDHYEARVRGQDSSDGEGGTPYKPVQPDTLYLDHEKALAGIKAFDALHLSPFETPDFEEGVRTLSLEARQGRNFAAERASGQGNIFQLLADHAANLRDESKKVVIASWSAGAQDRLVQVLEEHDLTNVKRIESFAELETLDQGVTALAVIGIESGFEDPQFAIIGEQDVLGDRLVKRRSGKRKGSDFLSEVSSLSAGDVVVHVDHGIARFHGLITIEAAGAPHDCLELRYHGDDKLFLPVENIELLSRYGSSDTEVMLDRLGGANWQARKAKLKKRVLEMAGELIAIAAARKLKTTDPIRLPEGLYDEFAARFPYEETEDQLTAIESVLGDLASGQPMDRLICGDVGFGKTEVALRAAFVTAMAGKQVAVVVPTTLLSRQHYKTFTERFHGLPLKIAQASRLVGSKQLSEAKAGAKDGTVDIIVGTHALLGKSVDFKRLGLLIIDEEQHFGVKHKERLKELKNDVHVLTLSATPIPRTLQLALTGVRELSLITTAPVDRMAVRTFISPFDGVTIREALLRERYRGGQSFYVCPRLSDLRGRQEFLSEQVPELKVAIAHGQMPPSELEDIMNAFYEGQYDVLLSTTIVESGLDIPTANTLIVHRADMFGLAQLYQLRGRVGRSKTRAYAMLTYSANKLLTPAAERRLKVLQTLDTLGAGFQLASHDLDIRGAGNILGEEQSGHVREVGFELYQQMLEEAVAELKDGGDGEIEGKWSPQITVGATVMIPESYVPDLTLRMSLYRRLAELDNAEDIDAFGAEMIDRFGPLPEEVDHLLKIVFVKALCRRANVEKLDAGPKGVVIQFRNREFADPGALIGWIGEQGSLAKIRPDQSIVLQRDWATPEKRLRGSAVVISQLAKMVA